MFVSESMTEIVGGPDIHVDRNSTLQMTCRVTSGNNTPAYIIWQRDDKVKISKLDAHYRIDNVRS